MPILASSPYLSAAQRQAQLRGMPYSKKTVNDILAGWYNSAGDTITADRQNALAAESVANAKAQSAASLAAEKETSAASLAQARAIADEQAKAAGTASTKSMVGNVASTALGVAATKYLTQQAANNLAQQGINQAADAMISGAAEGGSITAAGSQAAANVAAQQAAAQSTTASGTAAGGSTAGSFGSVATPVGFVLLGSSLHNTAGNTSKGWDEKTVSERHFTSPATTATLASNAITDPLMGGIALAGGMNDEDTPAGKLTKEVGRIEEQAMAPIHLLLGGTNIPLIGGGTSSGTWLCTEISARHGIDKDDQKALSKLRRWAIKNEHEDAEIYFKQGYKLIDVINKLENADDLYLDLKDKLVGATCDLVRKDVLQGAFAKYKEITAGLCKEYGAALQ